MNPINIEYWIDGTQVSPRNWELIGLTADLTQDYADLMLTDDTLIFEGNDKALLQGILDNVGLQAAIPMIVKLPSDDATVPDLEIEYVLSVKDGFTETTDTLEFSAKRRYGINRFIEKANSLTWDEINDFSTISATQFPYRIINPDPLPQLGMLTMQLGASSIALYDSVALLGFAISSALGGTTGILESTSQIAIAAVKTALVLVVLVTTAKDLFRMYFPEQKYLWEVKVLQLMQKGCAKLGFNLSSTLLQNYANAGIIPVPLLDTNDSMLNDLFGGTDYFNGKFPSSLDTTPTFGSFFTAIKEMLAAKILIIGNTLYFESDAFYQNAPQGQVKTTFTNQDQLIDQKTYNTSESWFNKFIGYTVDFSDRFTADKIKGTRAEYRTVYTGTAAADLVDIDGAKRIDIPFSLAKRKDKLSYLDYQAIIFGTVVDGIINFFGGSSNLVVSVIGSIGQMIISDQHFGNTKFVWSIGGKQPVNYLDKISADAIYLNNHTHLQVKENFKEIQEMTVPFSVNNFRNLINSRYVLDENNVSLQLLSYSFLPVNSQILLNFGIFRPEKSKTETIKIHG